MDNFRVIIILSTTVSCLFIFVTALRENLISVGTTQNWIGKQKVRKTNSDFVQCHLATLFLELQRGPYYVTQNGLDLANRSIERSRLVSSSPLIQKMLLAQTCALKLEHNFQDVVHPKSATQRLEMLFVLRFKDISASVTNSRTVAISIEPSQENLVKLDFILEHSSKITRFDSLKRLHSTLTENKVQNFKGRILNVLIMKDPLMSRIERDRSPKLVGYSFYEELLKVFSKKFNFRYTFSLSFAGKNLGNGTFDGMVGDIQNQSADIGCGLTLTLERADVIDFPRALLWDPFLFVTAYERTHSHWSSLERPFQPLVWLLIGIGIVASAVSMTVISIVKTIICQKPPEEISVRNSTSSIYQLQSAAGTPSSVKYKKTIRKTSVNGCWKRMRLAHLKEAITSSKQPGERRHKRRLCVSNRRVTLLRIYFLHIPQNTMQRYMNYVVQLKKPNAVVLFNGLQVVSNSVMYVYCVLLQQAYCWNIQKKLQISYLQVVTWIMFCLVIGSLYKSILISFFTKESPMVLPRTFEDLVDMDYTFATDTNTANLYLMRSAQNKHLQHITNQILNEDVFVGSKTITQSKRAYFAVESFAKTEITKTVMKTGKETRKDLRVNIGSQHVTMMRRGWGVQKGSRLKELFNPEILRTHESGLLNKWVDKTYQSYYEDNSFDSKRGFGDDIPLKQISLQQLSAIFHLLGIFVAFGSLVFLLEYLIFRKRFRGESLDNSSSA